MKADLHSHTTYSDGRLTVNELVLRARQKGLDYLAITDHDAIIGAIEGYRKYKGINVIVGVELSTNRNGESVHILGYFKNPESAALLVEELKIQREKRNKRAYEMLDLLEKHFDIKLNDDFIEKKYCVTRGTIASEIIHQGYNYNKNEIFSKLIGNKCKAYIPSTNLTPIEGINLIKKCNGLVVIAHPVLFEKNNVEDIIKLGVDGIEGIYPNPKNDEQYFRSLAEKYNLFITAGSDFHYIDDNKHGDVGDKFIKDKDLEIFLGRLEYEY